MVVRVAVLADDTTGAADTAGSFVSAGLTSVVATQPGLDPATDVVAYDIATRDKDPDTAAVRARSAAHAALALSPEYLYKKIDSTLRGHVGIEVRQTMSALAEVTAKRVVTVAAVAFPALGRVVRDGQVHIAPAGLASDGTLHAALPVSVTDAFAGHRTGRILLADVRRGVDHVVRLLSLHVEAGVEVIVLDSEESNDLRVAAMAGAAMSRQNVDLEVLWVGSGGLARELPRAWGLVPEAPPPQRAVPVQPGRIAAVIGSNTPIARAQHAALAGRVGVTAVEIDPAGFRKADRGAKRDAMRMLEQALLIGDVSLTLASAPPGVAAELREHAAKTLADMIAASSRSIGALIITGGQTTAAVLAAYGIRSMRVICEMEPGVVACVPVGKPPVLLFSKAGGFGDVETLARCHSHIAGLMNDCVSNRRAGFPPKSKEEGA